MHAFGVSVYWVVVKPNGKSFHLIARRHSRDLGRELINEI